jgi:hypothetical protein
MTIVKLGEPFSSFNHVVKLKEIPSTITVYRGGSFISGLKSFGQKLLDTGKKVIRPVANFVKDRLVPVFARKGREKAEVLVRKGYNRLPNQVKNIVGEREVRNLVNRGIDKLENEVGKRLVNIGVRYGSPPNIPLPALPAQRAAGIRRLQGKGVKLQGHGVRMKATRGSGKKRAKPKKKVAKKPSIGRAFLKRVMKRKGVRKTH